MARIKRGVNAVKKRRKILKLAKGYYGAKSKQYRAANQAVMKSLQYAYVGRRLKKRDFRSLWITRINAAGPLERPLLQPYDQRPQACRSRRGPQGARRLGCQ